MANKGKTGAQAAEHFDTLIKEELAKSASAISIAQTLGRAPSPAGITEIMEMAKETVKTTYNDPEFAKHPHKHEKLQENLEAGLKNIQEKWAEHNAQVDARNSEKSFFSRKEPRGDMLSQGALATIINTVKAVVTEDAVQQFPPISQEQRAAALGASKAIQNAVANKDNIPAGSTTARASVESTVQRSR